MGVPLDCRDVEAITEAGKFRLARRFAHSVGRAFQLIARVARSGKPDLRQGSRVTARVALDRTLR